MREDNPVQFHYSTAQNPLTKPDFGRFLFNQEKIQSSTNDIITLMTKM